MPKSNLSFVLILSIGLLSLASVGCNSGTQDLTPYESRLAQNQSGFTGAPMFKEIEQTVFLNPQVPARKCAACHVEGGNDLNLTEGSAFNELTNEPSQNYGRDSRVIPGDAENSLLVQKLTSTSAGSQMPLVGGAYESDSCEIRLIKIWINAGASETMTKEEALEKLGLEIDPNCDAVKEEEPEVVAEKPVEKEEEEEPKTKTEEKEVKEKTPEVVVEEPIVDEKNDSEKKEDSKVKEKNDITLFSEISDKIFMNPSDASRRCASCHSESGRLGNLVLEGDFAFNALTSEPSAGYNRPARIMVNDSENSLIVEKLLGKPGVGLQMPMGATPYAANSCEINLLRLWIDAGAEKNITRAKALEKLNRTDDLGCN